MKATGGFLSRRRVQHVRLRAVPVLEWRDHWRAATEAAWERVEAADRRRACPLTHDETVHPVWRCPGCGWYPR